MGQQKSAGIGRRRFLNGFMATAAAGLAAAVIYPVLRFLSPPEQAEAATREVDAGPTNDPAFLEKGYKIVQFGADPVIVVRVSDTEFRAFTATCTHLACIVEYRKSQQAIWCNCHNGHFDLQGRVVAGPPPRPLTALDVHLVAKGAGAPATVVVSRS